MERRQATEVNLEVPTWWGAGRQRGPRPPVESDLKKTGSCGSGALKPQVTKTNTPAAPAKGVGWLLAQLLGPQPRAGQTELPKEQWPLFFLVVSMSQESLGAFRVAVLGS